MTIPGKSGDLRRLQNRQFIEFSDLFDPTCGVPVVVVHFIALLELAKETLIDLTQAEAFAPIYAALKRTAMILVIGTAVAGLLAYALARRLTGPIRLLEEGTERIRAGDFAHQRAGADVHYLNRGSVSDIEPAGLRVHRVSKLWHAFLNAETRLGTAHFRAYPAWRHEK